MEKGPGMPSSFDKKPEEKKPSLISDPLTEQLADLHREIIDAENGKRSPSAKKRKDSRVNWGILMQYWDEINRKRIPELENQAATDALTGLPNRRYLEEMASQWMSLSERREKEGNFKPICVLYIDLDKFKLINDTLGHEAGDLYLVKIAEHMKKDMRGNDVLARIGGDEFAVLLYDTDEAGAQKVAEHLMQAVLEGSAEAKQTYQSTHAAQFSDQDANVGASIGFSVLKKGEKVEETIKRADQAMYQAKHGGGAKILSSSKIGEGDKPSD